MATPQQRLEAAVDRLEQAVHDRQEQMQREEYEFMRQVSQQLADVKQRYEQEERAWQEGWQNVNQEETLRRRKQQSIWDSS